MKKVLIILFFFLSLSVFSDDVEQSFLQSVNITSINLTGNSILLDPINVDLSLFDKSLVSKNIVEKLSIALPNLIAPTGNVSNDRPATLYLAVYAQVNSENLISYRLVLMLNDNFHRKVVYLYEYGTSDVESIINDIYASVDPLLDQFIAKMNGI